MNEWIYDFTALNDKERYLVASIHGGCSPDSNNKHYYPARPAFMRGYEVKRLMKGCYVALKLPDGDLVIPNL